MSILNEINNEEEKIKKKADRVRFLAENFHNQAIRCWEEIHEAVYVDSDSQRILDSLGEDAASVVEFNEDLFSFIHDSLSGKKQSLVDALVLRHIEQQDIEVHDDGTVSKTQ